MIESYEPYCMADPLFFELPRHLDDHDSRFDVGRLPTPPGWTRTEMETWLVFRPDGVPLPSQGWKVHLSTSLADAEPALDAVWDHCLRHRIAFKFLRSGAALRAANFKYAPRGGSGKLAALYPTDAQLTDTLEQLGAALAGRVGPYILTDLRWRSGPLFVRYGSFVERYCSGPDGEMVLALEGPDGRLVPDERSPVFEVPSWVDVPDHLAAQMAAIQAETQASTLPYQVEAALHFSNGGGVYLARSTDTGQQVVLKEARPYAGLDRSDTDAVARLDREWRMLRRLDGLDLAPRALDKLTCWEHHFLVLEYIEGESLQQARARQHPLSYPDPSDDVVAEYTRWSLHVLAQVEAALAELHRRGIAYCDLQPANVMLRQDGRILLVDFEQACDATESRPRGLGVPGFTSPIIPPGVAADQYALGCLRLAMFLPLTGLLQADPAKLDLLLDYVTERFPLPESFAQQVRTEIRPGLPAAPAVPIDRHTWSTLDWERLRDSIVGGILATASPARNDRLFPGDPQQFQYGGYTLAYGAAGVLLALSTVGVPVLDDHVDWIVTAARRAIQPRVGLLDGLHGVAYALDRLGRREEATAVLDRAMTMPLPAGRSYFGGQAGIGLTRLHFAQELSDTKLDDLAAQSAGRLLDALAQDEGGEGPQPGALTHGWAGVALFLIRMYEHTGDPALLQGAIDALDRNLSSCQEMPGGAVHLSDGVRVQPFLADGSAGVGLALAAVRVHADSERYRSLATGIDRACSGELVFEPGLFHGRAGLLAYRGLVDLHGEHDPIRHAAILASARRLVWHALPYGGYTAFTGRMLLRLSADLATGSAGVLLALHGALHDDGPSLPFPGLRPATIPTTAQRR